MKYLRTKIHRLVILPATAFSLLFSCTTQQDNSPIRLSTTSSCGGFKSFSKQTEFPVTVDSVTYCDAERLVWDYDNVADVLYLMHTRIIANCAAKLVLEGTVDRNDIALREVDISDSTTHTRCDCVFDTYCEISGIVEGTAMISLGAQVYTLYLDEGMGTLVVGSVPVNYPCR